MEGTGHAAREIASLALALFARTGRHPVDAETAAMAADAAGAGWPPRAPSAAAGSFARILGALGELDDADFRRAAAHAEAGRGFGAATPSTTLAAVVSLDSLRLADGCEPATSAVATLSGILPSLRPEPEESYLPGP